MTLSLTMIITSVTPIVTQLLLKVRGNKFYGNGNSKGTPFSDEVDYVHTSLKYYDIN